MADLSLNERQALVQDAVQAARGSTDCYVIELYDDRAVYEVYGNGPDAGKSFEVPYTIAADGTVTLGDRTEVERQVTYMAVKSVGKDLIEGPAFLFNKDLVGERFTPETDLCIEWFGKSGRPLLYEHGLDDSMKAALIGRQVDYEQRDEGIWAQSQLDVGARYRKAIDGLIDRGALSYSGGGMAHLATKSRSGDLKRFPWVELSLTPTPMNPANEGVYYVKSALAIQHLADVNIAIPAPLKAALAALDEWADSRDDDGLPDGLKFADHADRLLADVTAFRDRTEAISGLRVKSGRVLSAATRERLLRHPASLRELATDLDDLLASADGSKSTADLWEQLIQAEATQARYLGVPIPAGGPS